MLKQVSVTPQILNYILKRDKTGAQTEEVSVMRPQVNTVTAAPSELIWTYVQDVTQRSRWIERSPSEQAGRIFQPTWERLRIPQEELEAVGRLDHTDEAAATASWRKA